MEQDHKSISWNLLPWKKFRRKSFRLQRKIYEAKQNEKYKEIKRFQKLLLASKSLYYLAVRKITDSYMSKGIFLSRQAKLNMVDQLYKAFYRYKNLISTSKKSLHFFNIEFLKNETFCYIWRYVLDPLYIKSFSNTKNQLDSISDLRTFFNTSNLVLKFKKERILTLDESSEKMKYLLKVVSSSSIKYIPFKVRLMRLILFNPYFSLECSVFRKRLYLLFLKRILLYSKNSNLHSNHLRYVCTNE